MGWNPPHKATESIIYLFVDFFHSKQAILSLTTGTTLEATRCDHKQGKVPSLGNDLKYKVAHTYRSKGFVIPRL